MKMLAFIKKHKLTFIGAFIGAIGGYSYYYFVGCQSGTCAITSSPVNMLLYGILLGGLLFNIFETPSKK
jgi:hypothetical protein